MVGEEDELSRSSNEEQRLQSLEKLLKLERKKLQVLKNAVLEERQSKEVLKKDLSTAKERLIRLEDDVKEKDQKYMKVYEENLKLHDAVISSLNKTGQLVGSPPLTRRLAVEEEGLAEEEQVEEEERGGVAGGPLRLRARGGGREAQADREEAGQHDPVQGHGAHERARERADGPRVSGARALTLLTAP